MNILNKPFILKFLSTVQQNWPFYTVLKNFKGYFLNPFLPLALTRGGGGRGHTSNVVLNSTGLFTI